MKILFLGGNMVKDLADWLKQQEENIIYREDKVSLDNVKKVCPDFIISYNYKYIIPKEIINYVDGNAINLHISYLPYNRGSHPNVWSFLEETPKGVTIHYIDEGIDTGDIIAQAEVYIDEEKETLKSSYEILHREIQELFKENWDKIKKCEIIPQPQTGGGSIHFRKEFSKFEPFIRDKGWDTQIRVLKKRYNNWRHNIQGFGV